MVINQVLDAETSPTFLATRRKDQQRAMEKLRNDAELGALQLIEAPLFDLEVRGIPALTYFGQKVWKD
jgi:arsenite-transporting ATPase